MKYALIGPESLKPVLKKYGLMEAPTGPRDLVWNESGEPIAGAESALQVNNYQEDKMQELRDQLLSVR
jgi:hypothetical protein